MRLSSAILDRCVHLRDVIKMAINPTKGGNFNLAFISAAIRLRETVCVKMWVCVCVFVQEVMGRRSNVRERERKRSSLEEGCSMTERVFERLIYLPLPSLFHRPSLSLSSLKCLFYYQHTYSFFAFLTTMSQLISRRFIVMNVCL